MRIDIKKVKDREYLQYVNPSGFVFHIGPADKLENWQLAAWLYGCGLQEMRWKFLKRVKAQTLQRFGQEKDLSSFLNAGFNGMIRISDKKFENRLRKFDMKIMHFDNLIEEVKAVYPKIGKTDLKLAVQRVSKNSY